MKKASNILFIIGYVSIIFSLIVFTIFTVVCFMISAPSYTGELVKQIQEGSIVTNREGTITEQAKDIQQMFLVLAVIFLVVTLINAAKMIVTFLARKRNSNPLYLTSIILGALSIDPFILLASIFTMVANKQEVEEINASY